MFLNRPLSQTGTLPARGALFTPPLQLASVLQEPLVIPRLSANIDREFSELLGRHLGNPGWTGFYMAAARQIVKFQLDESGAVLESEADAAFVSEFGDDEPKKKPKPRRFIFDKPFLVILQQRNATQPYFAAWIANEELLSPISESTK